MNSSSKINVAAVEPAGEFENINNSIIDNACRTVFSLVLPEWATSARDADDAMKAQCTAAHQQAMGRCSTRSHGDHRDAKAYTPGRRSDKGAVDVDAVALAAVFQGQQPHGARGCIQGGGPCCVDELSRQGHPGCGIEPPGARSSTTRSKSQGAQAATMARTRWGRGG